MHRPRSAGPTFVEPGNHERPGCGSPILPALWGARRCPSLFVGSRRPIPARHPIHLAFSRRGRQLRRRRWSRGCKELDELAAPSSSRAPSPQVNPILGSGHPFRHQQGPVRNVIPQSLGSAADHLNRRPRIWPLDGPPWLTRPKAEIPHLRRTAKHHSNHHSTQGAAPRHHANH